ncbi:hypothetical protein CSOJ01_07633 [Colletotrichum sojae]|uniref:Uncharacterized protein n=1 Tax=Colletotrichum sojae TaxID=2175907 RepID=A0A8H6MU33_9PEZI|nr:hypothetical protein CSOJ01_07633 [Colletotrichum sojae]
MAHFPSPEHLSNTNQRDAFFCAAQPVIPEIPSAMPPPSPQHTTSHLEASLDASLDASGDRAPVLSCPVRRPRLDLRDLTTLSARWEMMISHRISALASQFPFPVDHNLKRDKNDPKLATLPRSFRAYDVLAQAAPNVGRVPVIMRTTQPPQEQENRGPAAKVILSSQQYSYGVSSIQYPVSSIQYPVSSIHTRTLTVRGLTLCSASIQHVGHCPPPFSLLFNGDGACPVRIPPFRSRLVHSACSALLTVHSTEHSDD